jgi:hypothetical protein
VCRFLARTALFTSNAVTRRNGCLERIAHPDSGRLVAGSQHPGFRDRVRMARDSRPKHGSRKEAALFANADPLTWLA